MDIIIIKEGDIKKVFNMKEAIKASKDALELYSKGGSDIPLRVSVDVPKENAKSLYMPGIVEGEEALGVKIVSTYPKNISKGLDTIYSMMVMKNAQTGEISSIIDGNYLTKLRTGAVAGAATDILARQDSKTFTLIGTGGQAQTQLEAVLSVRAIKEVKVLGRDKEKAEKFIEEMQEEFGKKYGCNIVLAEDPDEAVSDADIITAVTTSNSPVFDGSKLKEGVHINGIGSFKPDMQEIDPYVLENSGKIYVDTLDGVLNESGDFIIPLEKGKISKDDIDGELGDIILGEKPTRENNEEITLFKSVGTAVLDLISAKRIYDKAIEEGIGQNIKL